MENFFLSSIVREIKPQITGRSLSKLSLAGAELTLDFRLPDGRVLKALLDPASPALYLSGTEEKPIRAKHQSTGGFILQLRTKILGARLVLVSKVALDRIIHFEFEGFDPGGERVRYFLVLSLTGRTTNLYLADERAEVVAALSDRGDLDIKELLRADAKESSPETLLKGEELTGDLTEAEILERFFGANSSFGPTLKRDFIARSHLEGPRAGFRSLVRDLFEAPPLPMVYSRLPIEAVGSRLIDPRSDILLSHIELLQAQGMRRYEFGSLSEASECFYRLRAEAKNFQDKYNALRRALTDRIKKQEARLRGLEGDLARFDDPERMKRYGDLLLANLSTARINKTTASVIDYYDPEQPTIEIELKEGVTLPEAANDYFARYQKGKRAREAITPRLASLTKSLESLRFLLGRLEQEPSAERADEVRIEARNSFGIRLPGEGAEPGAKERGSKKGKEAGRWFISTDGYQIGVGRNDRENDHLTFRASRPQDIWLHAADYPGSHVVIRNPRREEVPYSTILEAAEIAAYYSQARREAKAAVHYTQKKFVSKPPKAKPGLVRLSSFKTALVQPGCNLERME